MKRMFLTACMAFAFLNLSAQENPYIVKTKGAKKSAMTKMADELSAAQQEQEDAKDFIAQNFKFYSLCDWQEGMKFMVMPEKYDLVVKTFTDAATGKEVSSMPLKYKIIRGIMRVLTVIRVLTSSARTTARSIIMRFPVVHSRTTAIPRQACRRWHIWVMWTLPVRS